MRLEAVPDEEPAYAANRGTAVFYAVAALAILVFALARLRRRRGFAP